MNENQYMGCGMCHMNSSMYPVPLQNERMNSNQDIQQNTAGVNQLMPSGGASQLAPSGISGMPMLQPAPEIPETYSSTLYTAGYLRTQIGKIMRVEFLIGNSLNDRVGRLLSVGDSYIILQSVEPGSTIMCDIYSIKFATIVSEQSRPLYPAS